MTTPLLSVEDLSVSIHGRHGMVQPLVHVDLSVQTGEVVALVGESGGGKSMIGRAVIGALPRGAVPDGQILCEGRDVLKMNDKELAQHRGGNVAVCFQNPRRALAPLRTIGKQLTDRMVIHQSMSRDAAGDAAVTLLESVGLRNAKQRLDSYPHELSGGMAQRVMIASALACKPKILIADEPTTGLDVTLTRDILELFRSIAETGTGVLLVSHDLASVAETSDRVAVLYAGSVVEVGPTTDVIARPRHPYTETLLKSVPDLDGAPISVTSGSMPLLRDVPQACTFEDRCDRATPTCSSQRPSLVPDGDRKFACFHPIDSESSTNEEQASSKRRTPKSSGETLISVVDAHVTYPGRIGSKGHRALRGVSFTVRRGETLGIVGESGCGKSTLARMLMALTPPSSGEVAVAGFDFAKLNRRHLRQFRSGIQMVFQDPVGSLSPRRSVQQAIIEPLAAAGASRAECAKRSMELIQRVGLDQSMLERRPHELSGGQAQRVSIARALSVDPQVVVFDEPTSALDVTVQAQILDLLQELADAGDRAYVFISHDLPTVRSMSDRVAVLYLGRIVEIGSSDAIFKRPRHPYTQALLAANPNLRPGSGRPAVRLSRDLAEAKVGDGCPLANRCPYVGQDCATDPSLTGDGDHSVACWYADDIAAGRRTPSADPVETDKRSPEEGTK